MCFECDKKDETLKACQPFSFLVTLPSLWLDQNHRSASQKKSIMFLWFFISYCVWRACFAVEQAPSLWPNLMPLFGSDCGLFLYRSHDPARTVCGFNHLDSRGVSPLCPFLPVFLFASLLWVENMLACFHSMCFLFSSQQLRGWRGGILAVCVVCSNRRNSSTGSSSSSFLTPLSAVALTMS